MGARPQRTALPLGGRCRVGARLRRTALLRRQLFGGIGGWRTRAENRLPQGGGGRMGGEGVTDPVSPPPPAHAPAAKAKDRRRPVRTVCPNDEMESLPLDIVPPVRLV